MASSETAICNSALNKIGVPQITNINDDNGRAKACKLQYEKVRDHLLRSHFWNFANRRTTLALDTFGVATTDIAIATDYITESLHGRSTGDKFEITTTSALPTPLLVNTTYFIIKIDGNTFQLATTFKNATAGTNIDLLDVGVGVHTFESKPAFQWDYKYVLPTDYLRSTKLESHLDEFEIENGYLLANTDELNLKYISKVEDTEEFDPAFDELFALMLAHEISWKLVQSRTLTDSLANELQLVLRDTRSTDAQEGTPEDFETDSWTNSRL